MVLKIVTDLMFSDDIALLSEEMHQAQELLHRVEVEAESGILHINEKKTEMMHYGHTCPVSGNAKS